MSELKTPPKNRKRAMAEETTPVKNIRSGELAISSRLALCAVEYKQIPSKKQSVEDTYVASIIGTDGDDFIQLTGWGYQHAKKMASFFTEETLGETFHIEHVRSIWPSNPDYNLGSVKIQLQWQEQTKVTKIDKTDNSCIPNSCESFYNYLANKHLMAAADETTTVKLTSVENSRPPYTVEVRLDSLSDIRRRGQNVSEELFKSPVINIKLADSTGVLTLSGWNIYAKFLENIFLGKEGTTIILKLPAIKFEKDGYTAKWDHTCRFRYADQITHKTTAKFLSDLMGINGNAEVSIQLVIIKEPFVYDSNKTTKICVVTDSIHKAQLVFPVDCDLPEDFILKQTGVVWTADGVLTLTLFSKDHMENSPKDMELDLSMDQMNVGKLTYPEKPYDEKEGKSSTEEAGHKKGTEKS